MCICIKEGCIALLGKGTDIHGQIVGMKVTVIQAIFRDMIKYDITIDFLLLDVIQSSRFVQTCYQCFVLVKWIDSGDDIARNGPKNKEE